MAARSDRRSGRSAPIGGQRKKDALLSGFYRLARAFSSSATRLAFATVP